MRFDVNKHIEFRLLEKGEKPHLNLWEVWNTMADCGIGLVQWYSRWRHYCFFPYDASVFSDRCLLRIGRFVEEQNNQRECSEDAERNALAHLETAFNELSALRKDPTRLPKAD